MADPVPRPDAPSEPRSKGPRRRPRPPAATVAPQALAAARGGAREGLDWLGRTPEVRASAVYRLLRLLARAIFFGLLRFEVRVDGREHVPAAHGYLLVAAIHRGWMDPFLIQHALPIEPRVWFLGSGPSAFDRRWKEWLLHRIGGMLPVWRGGVGVDQHVASARAVLDAGGVFVLMPEGTVSGPPDRLSAFRLGSAIIALRTGAPMLPLAIAGAEELYVGKRFATRIMPPTDARTLLGPAWDGVPPEPDSRAELALARALTDRLAELFEPVVAALYPGTVDPPDRPRRLRRLTWLFLAYRRPPT